MHQFTQTGCAREVGGSKLGCVAADSDSKYADAVCLQLESVEYCILCKAVNVVKRMCRILYSKSLQNRHTPIESKWCRIPYYTPIQIERAGEFDRSASSTESRTRCMPAPPMPTYSSCYPRHTLSTHSLKQRWCPVLA